MVSAVHKDDSNVNECIEGSNVQTFRIQQGMATQLGTAGLKLRHNSLAEPNFRRLKF